MERKRARTKAKKAAPARAKRQIRRKKHAARSHEDAVIHQDVYFAEAPTEP